MKNSFDDILKKKWEALQFPVDNDHRDDMIRLLDQHNRRRTGLFWWFGGIGGGIVIIAATILLINRNNTSGQIPVSPSKNVEKEIVQQNIDHTGQHLSPLIDKTEGIAEPEIGSESEIKTERERESEKRISHESNVKAGSSLKASDLSMEKGDKKVHTKNQSGATSNKNLLVNDSQSGIDIDKLVVPHENITPDSPNAPGSNASSAIYNEVPVVVPGKSESRTIFSVTEPIDVLAINELLFSRESLKKVSPVIAKRHPVYLFAETGFGLLPASSKPKYSSGWTWRAGGGLDYGFNSKQHISLSLGYLLQKDGFDFEKNSTVQQADFGARSNFHSLSPDKLHFVYARFGVHQRIHRHVLSLFAGTQYLYGAQGTIVIRSQGLLTGDDTDTKYGWLNISGMSRWLWSGEAQYGYQISPKVSLHAGLKYNFTSLKTTDDSLEDDGYYWDGKISSVSPFLTINYHLYGKK